ncbi:MAG: hypothetical protein WCI73_02525 [Phycisphaerae bacterium]
MSEPSPKGENGRAGNGRFAQGWKGGPGNPHARRVAKLRSAMLRAVTSADVRAIILRLLESAKAGDVSAAKELLTRCLGPAEAIDVLQRLESLEATINTEKNHANP